MKKVEILAPAGDWTALRTAINNGADAVYLGMQGFNARAKAENFTKDNICEVTRLAHLFGVKIYLTVNTLINNNEVTDLIDLIKNAVQAKVDAYLVQDFGVLALLQHHFPNITLHASTQMGIHNLYGAKMAEKIGVKRIVLSRETKMEDIIQIKNNTNLELEYFVQGALCVAFSGNCYFSAYETGESGNRGRCKQLCRLPYTANLGTIAGQEKYLLSPADLCLLHNLKALIDAGICCFKIEGRLRRAGYVGQAVSTYRKVVDLLQNQASRDIEQNTEQDVERDIRQNIGQNIEQNIEQNTSGTSSKLSNKITGTSLLDEIIKQEQYNLRKVFSRGEFNTNAYLNNGVPDKIINYDTQNHTGIRIGKVLEVKPFKEKLKQVVVYSEKPLTQFDGLKFFENEKEVGSLGVGNVDNLGNNKYRIYTSQFIKTDWDINLIADYDKEKSFEDIRLSLPLEINVTAKIGKPLQIIGISNGVTSEYNSEFICEKGKNSPTNSQQITEQVGKIGDTHFHIKFIKVDCENVFIPKSILNDARRKCLENLENNIITLNEKSIKVDYNNTPLTFEQNKKNPFKKILVFSQLEQLQDYEISNKEILFVYAPEKYELKDIFTISSNFKNFGLNLPIIANGKDLELLDNIIAQNPKMFLLANNLYGLFYANTHQVIAGTGLNIYNNISEQKILSLGAMSCVLSFEQKTNNFELNDHTFVYSSGTPALMTFCHCPYKTVLQNNCSQCGYNEQLKYTNQAGEVFNIRRTQLSQCYFELLAPHPIQQKQAFKLEFIDLR